MPPRAAAALPVPLPRRRLPCRFVRRRRAPLGPPPPPPPPLRRSCCCCLAPPGARRRGGGPPAVPTPEAPPAAASAPADRRPDGADDDDVSLLLVGTPPCAVKGPVRPAPPVDGAVSSAKKGDLADAASWNDRPLGRRYREPYFSTRDVAGVRRPLSRSQIDGIVDDFFESAEAALQEPFPGFPPTGQA